MPAYAWVCSCIVEWTAGVMKDFAHFYTASDQVFANRFDIVYCQCQPVDRTRLHRSTSLAEDEGSLRVMGCDLNHTELFVLCEIAAGAPPDPLGDHFPTTTIRNPNPN